MWGMMLQPIVRTMAHESVGRANGSCPPPGSFSTDRHLMRAGGIAESPGSLSELPDSERPSEAQLMSIWIEYVEETLSPLGITRRAFRLQAGGNHASIKTVDIRFVKD